MGYRRGKLGLDSVAGAVLLALTMRTMSIAVVLGLFAFGCRASGGMVNVGPDSNSSNPDGATVTTVKDIRMNQPTNGTMLTVKGAVVTAHVSSKKSGSIWIQDAGGGEYSGIHVFCNYGGTKPNCTMTQAQIDMLAVGTVVDVTGQFNSFLLSTAPAGAQPQLEIEAPTITASTQTMQPVAVTVTADVIAKAQLASPGADPYKGAYVKVASSATVSNKTAMEFAASCTDKSMPPQMGTTFSGFEATANSQTLAIGLSFYNTMTYCLPCTGVAMPYACNNAITNQAFTSIAGIVEPDYNSNGQVYLRLSPVTDGDLPHS